MDGPDERPLVPLRFRIRQRDPEFRFRVFVRQPAGDPQLFQSVAEHRQLLQFLQQPLPQFQQLIPVLQPVFAEL